MHDAQLEQVASAAHAATAASQGWPAPMDVAAQSRHACPPSHAPTHALSAGAEPLGQTASSAQSDDATQLYKQSENDGGAQSSPA